MSVAFPNESPEYRAARDRLLARESELRRAMEDVAAARRALPPGGAIPEDYVFEGAEGSVRMSELFTPGSDALVVYSMMFQDKIGLSASVKFATGFVLLMLVHELGHSFAMRYYRLSASPPIFIPFLGALINLRQMPRNALEEAVVGIGGPVTGTLAAGVTYLIYLKTGSSLMLMLAEFGFLLNLFNMIPVPPLDGGRVTAAVTPWIWMPGLLIVAAWIVFDFLVFGKINPILILLLLFAWPRVMQTLVLRKQGGPYYRIGKWAHVGMGAAYALLGGVLVVMYILCRIEMARRFGPGLMG